MSATKTYAEKRIEKLQKNIDFQKKVKASIAKSSDIDASDSEAKCDEIIGLLESQIQFIRDRNK